MFPANPMITGLDLSEYEEPEVNEWFTLEDAKRVFFKKRSPSTIQADARFLGIDTKKGFGRGCLNKSDLWTIYLFIYWRVKNQSPRKKQYWRDCTPANVIGPCSSKTATVELRLSFATRFNQVNPDGKVFDIEAHFDRLYDEEIELRKSKLNAELPLRSAEPI